jgi:hypothetical protein
MRCESRAVRVAQIAEGICSWQAQACIIQSGRYVAQHSEQGFA